MQVAYTDGAPWLDAVMTYLQGNLRHVRDALADLDGVDLIEPQGGFLVWLDFHALGLDPDALTAFLRGQAG